MDQLKTSSTKRRAIWVIAAFGCLLIIAFVWLGQPYSTVDSPHIRLQFSGTNQMPLAGIPTTRHWENATFHESSYDEATTDTNGVVEFPSRLRVASRFERIAKSFPAMFNLHATFGARSDCYAYFSENCKPQVSDGIRYYCSKQTDGRWLLAIDLGDNDMPREFEDKIAVLCGDVR